MKKYEVFLKEKILPFFILFITFFIKEINSQTSKYTKSFSFPSNNYYIINSETISFFNYNQNFYNIINIFRNDQIITSDKEIEIASFGGFNDYPSLYLLNIKHYIYALSNEGYVHCNVILNDTIGCYSFTLLPIKCYNYKCYYIIGLIDSNSKLYLYLYINSKNSCDSELIYKLEINGDSDNLNCHLLDWSTEDPKIICFYGNNTSNEIISSNFTVDLSNKTIEQISSISSPNNSGKIIKSYLFNNNSKAFVCYINEENNYYCQIYDINNNEWSNNSNNYLTNCLPNISSLNIEYIASSNEYLLYCFQSSTVFNLIKLDENFNIKNDEENGVYTINETLINECTEYTLISLVKNNETNNIDYLIICDKKIAQYKIQKYLIDTSQASTLNNKISTTPSTIISSKPSTIITSNPSTIISSKPSTIITSKPSTIISSKPSTIISSKPYTIISSKISIKESYKSIPSKLSTIIKKTSSLEEERPDLISTTSKLIQSSSIVSSLIKNKKDINDNEIIIIQKNCLKTKEEIIYNLNEFMKDYDSGKIYEIFGNDYEIKISPINTNRYNNISTYINFSNCENILRESNGLSSSDILTVYQIEIDNKYEQSLINGIEYAVFYEKNKRIDLSVCKDETIEINYQIKNISLIDKTKIYYYSEIGVDIFNSSDKFFNDICYSYSENNSDLILKDRIADIYENYSICEENCEYNGINITQYTINCQCSVKTNVDTEVDPPHLDEIIIDTFTDSNIGVIKCYKLVFNMSNKKKNIGFWIFTFLILLHIPIYIHYFIFNIKSIQKYINIELKKFGYWRYSLNPVKKYNSKHENKNKRNSIKLIKNIKDDKNIRNTVFISKKSFKPKNNLKNKRISTKKLLENNSSKVDIFKSNDLTNNTQLKPLVDNSKKSLVYLKFKNKKSIKNKIINKHKSSKNPVVFFNYSVYNKNYINLKKKKDRQIINNSQRINKSMTIQENKFKIIFFPEKYYLIQMDANNTCRKEPPDSNIILDNYEYKTAIKYEKRGFFRLFYICVLSKENIINLFFFNNPLNLRGLKICLFIFTYSCDFAFNTIFYSNQNISEKYHYEGNNLFFFTLVNNIVQSLTSTIVSLILINVFQELIDSRSNYEDVFRKEEQKMRKDRNYKITKKKKIEILKQINEINLKLKIKIIIFLISELSLILFFYYFVTAFCEVYKNTQVSWLLDFFISFLLSIATEIFGAWVISIFYILSIKYKIKCIYKLVLFFYNI